MNKMPKALILVAGEGTRLRPYTNDKPKCMVEIENTRLIQAQIDILRRVGITDITLVGGYKADKLNDLGLPVIVNHAYKTTNMVWTLFTAVEELKGDVIVSYGDIVYSENVIAALLASKNDISVIIDKDWEAYWRARNENILDDAETLKLDHSGQITEIGRKPKSLEEIHGQYIGLTKFSDVGVRQIKRIFKGSLSGGGLQGIATENAYMTDLLQECVSREITVSAVLVNGEWIEIDTVSDLESNTSKERFSEIYSRPR